MSERIVGILRITLCVLLCLFRTAPAQADFAVGMAAYNKGDYAVALDEFKKLETAKACYMLGTMYYRGKE